MAKLNEHLIQQLREGEIVAVNNGTLAQLREVIKEAFPYDCITPNGDCKEYGKSVNFKGDWNIEMNEISLRHKERVSIRDFYMEEKDIIEYKVKPRFEILSKNLFEAIDNIDVKGGWGRFDAVYKKEFKVGDIAVSTEGSMDYEEGEIGVIQSIRVLDGILKATFKDKPQSDSDHRTIDRFYRHATPKEIEEYNTPKLPKINGYEGEDLGEDAWIKYGCAYIDKNWFSGTGNRHIKSMTLSSGVDINEKQVEQIRKYLGKTK